MTQNVNVEVTLPILTVFILFVMSCHFFVIFNKFTVLFFLHRSDICYRLETQRHKARQTIIFPALSCLLERNVKKWSAACMYLRIVDPPFPSQAKVGRNWFNQCFCEKRHWMQRKQYTRIIQAYKLQSQEPTNKLIKLANTSYHRQCYSHFTNITKIKSAQRRREEVFIEETAKEGW